MLHFGRIDISESIDVNKTSASKECIIFYYFYFLEKGYTFQLDACNGFQDALMMFINLNDIAFISNRVVNYHSIY